ncbi:hypothetical protein BKA58DRAFT_371422 [Alternaria rosae]|uniref:uncharacterized protein n=1 Tax=Alternaria rosae TaxID=1187941 RepID=UPI001E8ED8C1|nr:uncharacterized protein BKA58DRAFT_371422 [Alternaria rosae]KAH6881358.1 hypothetical protein BKA58DRAFT_371422 [Alternaria rosae]
MIVELWNDLYCVEECDTEALHEQGLLNPEDDFGDNPEYMNAKKLWWEQKMGIRGIEAIARYHVGHVRSRRRLHRAAYFLIEEDDATLNYNSPEYLASRAEPEDVHKEYQFYNELHDSPVDWTAKSGCWIRLWRLSVTEIIPHNDFDEGYSEAYDALVEYQDSREPGCEAHEEPEEFARPLLTGRCVPTLATLERNRRDSYVQLKSMTSTVGVDLGDHHIPGSIPAAYRMVKDNASVSNSADRSSGRLIKHTGAVRDDEVVNPTGAVANAPSPKFFKAFLEKKAFGRAVNSSIQVPPGILSASPAVGIDIPDRDPDNLCNLIQQNAPGPVPIEGRVWVGLSNPEVSCYQHREQQDTTIRDHMALSRPRNDAENQLMGLLHLPVSKADSMHRPRRE